MAAPLVDTLQSVELADGVEIHLKVAGPGARCTAWLIDTVIFALVVFGLSMLIFGILGGLMGEGVAQGVYLLCLFALWWCYNIGFEMSAKAATPGQRQMGLRVVSVSGGPVRLPQSIIRNLLRVVDFMPGAYLLGLLCCLTSKRFQRLGDLVADTVVVYAEPKEKAKEAIKVNAEPEAPPVVLTREEQAAFLQFLDRAPYWSDARKTELSNLLEPLHQRDGLPGLIKTCAIGVWLRTQGGQPGSTAAAAPAAAPRPSLAKLPTKLS